MEIKHLRTKLSAAISDWVKGDSEVRVVEGFRGPVLKLRTVSATEDTDRKGNTQWYMKWGRGGEQEDYVVKDLAGVHKLAEELREQWNEWVAQYKAKEVKLAQIKVIKDDYEDLISVLAVIQRNMRADAQAGAGSAGMSEELQKFLVHWIVAFGGGSEAEKKKVFAQFAKYLPQIPDQFKKTRSGSVYRGMRVPLPELVQLVNGGKVKTTAPYLSFTTELKIAERFAEDSDSDARGKPRAGLILRAQSNRVVLDVENCYRAINRKFKDHHSDALALDEREVILENKPAFVIDAAAIEDVFLSEDALAKLGIKGAKLDDIWDEYLNYNDHVQIGVRDLKKYLK